MSLFLLLALSAVEVHSARCACAAHAHEGKQEEKVAAVAGLGLFSLILDVQEAALNGDLVVVGLGVVVEFVGEVVVAPADVLALAVTS